jgi:hypothetical protein
MTKYLLKKRSRASKNKEGKHICPTQNIIWLNYQSAALCTNN